MSIRESIVEDYLKKKVKALGGECWKLRFINRIGAPDRLILFPDEHALAELKRPKGKPTLIQMRIHTILRWAGFNVYVLDSIEAIDEVFPDG
jgi:hypothetical protein